MVYSVLILKLSPWAGSRTTNSLAVSALKPHSGSQVSVPFSLAESPLLFISCKSPSFQCPVTHFFSCCDFPHISCLKFLPFPYSCILIFSLLLSIFLVRPCSDWQRWVKYAAPSFPLTLDMWVSAGGGTQIKNIKLGGGWYTYMYIFENCWSWFILKDQWPRMETLHYSNSQWCNFITQ